MARRLLQASRNVRSIYALQGCVDEAEVPALHRQLLRFAATTTGDVVVDCLDLVSIDAAGASETARVPQLDARLQPSRQRPSNSGALPRDLRERPSRRAVGRGGYGGRRARAGAV